MGVAGPLPALEKPPAREDEEADPAWSAGSVRGDQQRGQSAGARARRAALSSPGERRAVLWKGRREEAGGSRARGHVGRSQKNGSGPRALVLQVWSLSPRPPSLVLGGGGVCRIKSGSRQHRVQHHFQGVCGGAAQKAT